VVKFGKNPIYRTSYCAETTLLSKIIFIVTVTLTFDLMTPPKIGFFPFQRGIMWPSLAKIWYTELKLLCRNLCGRPSVILNHIIRPGVDVTAGPWPVYLRSGQSNWTKIGPLGQLIFSGHLGQQLSFLQCHSISTDNRLMKFPDKTLKFNFDHSPKATVV
jgi:hypothetical protein